ncbi:MAG TPA: hypothetical protein ENJ97_02520 [Planctomycetes bacterium]|nr:hypothetical protein [Planctomycetota bacterium]
MGTIPQKKPCLRGLGALPGGRALLAGSFFGGLVFPSRLETWSSPRKWSDLKSKGSWDGFLACIGPFGKVLWGKALGGKGEDRVEALEIVQGGRGAFLLGLFHGDASFGEIPRTETITCGRGTGIFTALYDTEGGTLVRARKIGEGDSLQDLRLAVLSGGIGDGYYVSGLFRRRITLGRGEGSVSLNAAADGEEALFLARFDGEDQVVWAVKAATSRGGLLSGGLCAMPDGSAAVAGSFKGDLAAAPGTKRETRFGVSHGYWEIFMARFGPGGVMMWARHAAGRADDFAGALVSSSDGSLFLSGGLHHTVHFWEGKEEMEIGSGGGLNSFLARFQGDGTPVWGARGAAYGGRGEGLDIALREEGGEVNVYFTGFFNKLVSFKEPPYGYKNGPTRAQKQPYSFLLSPTGKENREDVFLACLRGNGETAWAARAGGIGDDEGLFVTILPDGSPLVAGTFMGPATFGLGEPNQTVLVQGTLFLAKYRP